MLDQWFSPSGDFAPGGHLAETFLVVLACVGELLLVSSGLRPRMLLNILQSERDPHNK